MPTGKYLFILEKDAVAIRKVFNEKIRCQKSHVTTSLIKTLNVFQAKSINDLKREGAMWST
jgi:hypothetical protein